MGTDDYRLVGRAITAVRARDEALAHRESELEAAFRAPLHSRLDPHWSWSHDQVTIAREFAAWLHSRQDDVELAAVIFDAAARIRAEREFIAERAEADIRVEEKKHNKNWDIEALEALAWERAGRP